MIAFVPLTAQGFQEQGLFPLSLSHPCHRRGEGDRRKEEREKEREEVGSTGTTRFHLAWVSGVFSIESVPDRGQGFA